MSSSSRSGGGGGGPSASGRNASSSTATPPASAPQHDEAPVQLLSSGPVRTLRLNRPKALNALNTEMVKLLHSHLDSIAPLPAAAASSSSAASARGSDAPIILLRGEGRALCSGGDVLAVVNAANSKDPAVKQQSLEFFKAEYELDYRIASLARATGKIFISIMDGITMGGGVGLSVHAPFRIATERTLFAMPETGIGLWPDVGVTRALARLDGPGASVGNYLGLTGARLGGEEAYLAGLATHFVPSSSIDSLVHRLETLEPRTARDIAAVDAALSEFAANPLHESYASSSASPSAHWASKSALLGARRIALDWAFGSSKADAKAIVEALEALASGSEAALSDKALLQAFDKAGYGGSGIPSEVTTWAQETLQALRTKSPRSVVVTHMAIKTQVEASRGAQALLAKNISPNSDEFFSHPAARFSFLDATFRLDMALATRFCDLSLGRDFYEGVTFTLTKDPATGKRRQGVAPWEHARIEDVHPPHTVGRFFGRVGPGSTVREGNQAFAVPRLDIKGVGFDGGPVGPEAWVPAHNPFALPSEAELAALCQGTHPASGSVAIVEPEEIVSVLAGWRAGKRPLDKISRGSGASGSKASGDGDKVGMLEKVREWARRSL
ncbi:unnamed protein product [Tilletia controversa]|nr:unnamed protein product [Tilletia caries]CAD6909296.1 unnamed protein product [Tilletia controversa]CAD6950618.1 unnamed protein product [Tilletia controversa]CAD6963015.1 unnamed protein product [Tilletia controversa]CAD6984278.1 unnamed protein product [Tilletia controversa]